MTTRLIALFIGALLHSKVLFATPIVDTVTIDGREWAQPDLFTGVTWDRINAVCSGGVCGSGLVNGWDMQGWVWASYSDMTTLFNPYVERDGGTGDELLSAMPDSYVFTFDDNVFAAPIPYEFFEETLLRPTDTYVARVCGSVSCVDDTGPSLILDGWLSDRMLPGFSGRTEGAYASFQALGGLENSLARPSRAVFDSFNRSGSLDTNTRNNVGGGWFYQGAHVPLPGTVWLFGIALLLLSSTRRA
ncbi:MAG: hypothetical protein KDI09_19115 [Halioglobus sp.]|nr:hypothetical protein [Halioglobus sp.]